MDPPREVEYLGDDVAAGEGDDVGAGDLVCALVGRRRHAALARVTRSSASGTQRRVGARAVLVVGTRQQHGRVAALGLCRDGGRQSIYWIHGIMRDPGGG